MSANLISALSDEGSDLHKQIGCMTGILQIFDRQHLLSGRRPTTHSLKRLPSGNITAEPYGCSPQVALDKNCSLNEKERLSAELSQNSFSSSSCSSSFSSIDCNRSTQQEQSMNDASTYTETSTGNLPKFRLHPNNMANRIIPSSGSSNASIKGIGPSSDFWDVVKDSIYREAHGSIKTSAIECHRDLHPIKLKEKDPPRLQKLSKSEDESFLITTGKNKQTSVDVDDLLNSTTKFKEKSHHLLELGELPRSSSVIIRENCSFSLSSSTPRFSYEGRDNPRISLDSRESSTSASRLRDLPRLSLDSRELSMQDSDFDMRTNAISIDLDKKVLQQQISRVMPKNQMAREELQSPSVVAKLMGLEVMPNIRNSSPSFVGLKDSNASESERMGGFSSNSSGYYNLSKKSTKVTIVPQKMIPHPKIPMETAPWRQPVKGRTSPKGVPGCSETHVTQKHESVYGEIQKKLNDLEFQPCNKDLRALKQILDAIHAKGLLEVKHREEIHSSEVSVKKTYNWQSASVVEPDLVSGAAKCHLDVPSIPKLATETSTLKTWDSPIVIMKPAKSFSGCIHNSSSKILEGAFGLPIVPTTNAANTSHISADNQFEEDCLPKNLLTETRVHVPITEKKSSHKIEETMQQKAQLKPPPASSRHQKLLTESGGDMSKTSNSSSPRLQQKKYAIERKSCSSPSLDSGKQRKPPNQSSELVSPRYKGKSKSSTEKQFTKKSCNGSKSKSKSTEISQNLSHNKLASFHPSQNTTRKVADGSPSIVRKKKNIHTDSCSYSEGIVTSEQPSPVSVLDTLLYKDEHSSSTTKSAFLSSNDPGNDGTADRSVNTRWISTGADGLQSREFDNNKLRNIEDLVEKLEQLCSKDNQELETSPLTSSREIQNPNYHYVSEILLASGFLLNNLDVAFPSIQLHHSGYPIDPKFFLVLEQKRSGSLMRPEPTNQNALKTKTANLERDRRRLIFDTVNEILLQKFGMDGAGPLPVSWFPAGKLSKRLCCGQFLPKDLCVEIDLLRSNSQMGGGFCSQQRDDLRLILDRDFEQQSDGWTGMGKEVSWLVLDIERSIFKDLIGEVVFGWTPMLQVKPFSRRRQLFV